MAKNLVKNNAQPVAMEMGAKNHEAAAASPNLERSAAYDAPMRNNAAREMPHLGNKPRSGDGKF